MRLKEIKAQPLLSPPGADTWWLMTEKDIRMMEADLERLRNGNTADCGGYQIARHHFATRRLGLPQEITPDDEQMMRQDLMWLRSQDNPKALSGILGHMIGCGLKAKVEESDLSAILKQLGSYRGRDWADGFLIAETHVDLKRMGHPQEVTEEDIVNMRRTLEENRKVLMKKCTVPMMLYLLRELELKESMTDSDVKIMEESMKSARTDEGKWNLADSLLHIQELLPSRQPRHQETSIPPIKKYGGSK